jgi:hypothetical protein
MFIISYTGFAASVCVRHGNYHFHFLLRLFISLCLRSHSAINMCLTSRDLSYLHGAFLWFSMTYNGVSLLGTQEVKVKWTFLTAHVRRSRCEAQTVSHVHPCNASFWVQMS